MTSSDLRDVLNLPDGQVGPRPAKKQKTASSRPNLKGLAREVQSLGGDNPIAIVPQVPAFKKRRFVSRKPVGRWERREFKNSAREDGTLVLRHWRRAADGGLPSKTDASQQDQPMENGVEQHEDPAPPIEDSTYAIFNAKIPVTQYSDEQYKAHLENDDWTKEETDFLFVLVREFDLRWPLIWDRYEYVPTALKREASADDGESKAIVPASKQRTMEDLKARYYTVSAKLMAVQRPVQHMTQAERTLYDLMDNFNPHQEKQRKELAANSMMRSREEAKEEESLLLEIKRILARNERFNEERRDLYSRLDFPQTEAQDISTFKTSAGLHNLLQNLMNVDKSRKRKSLVGSDGISPSMAGQGGPDPAGRRDSLPATSAGGLAYNRESLGGQTPTSASGKKGAQLLLERKRLSEQEHAIYGVSQHDRLNNGATFRTEKTNKLFANKSNQMQLRITNVLNELDIPPRLAMPTSNVTAQYEKLLQAVTTLLESRKVNDKLDAEIKIELAKKTERENRNASESRPSASTRNVEDAGNQASADNIAEAAAPNGDAGTTTGEASQTQAISNGQPQDKAEGQPAAPVPSAAPAPIPTLQESATLSVEPKEGTALEKEREKDKTPRPGSSSASHKRSASVLSSLSDKSTKRQKK